MDLQVVSGKPQVTGVSIVWRHIRGDVGTTCDGDDEYTTVLTPREAELVMVHQGAPGDEHQADGGA